MRYAATANAIVCAFAVGDAPAQTWHADGAILDWDHAPADLRAAFERGATFAAWNASFDAAIWNYSTLGFPFLPPERVIDPMIQAGVSNLPTDLESASRSLGGAGKQKDGKKLIKLFCVEGAAPSEHPEEWQRFLSYARQDVEAMREVYRRTRPLPLEEWQQYWAFEHINRRGVAVDLPFVRRAAALAAEDAVASGRRLAELTDGAVTKVTQAKRIAAWLHDQLPDAAMREVLTVGVPADDDDDDDDEAEPPELSLTRDRVARVLAMLEAKRANGGLDPAETKAHEVATLRLYGAGASPKKFARLEAQQVDGVLRGQYRFAGAGQTGRMTARGRANSESGPRRARRGWRRGGGAGRCDRRRLQLRRRWPRRSRSTCRWRASSPCSCVPPSLPGPGKYSSGRTGRRSRRGSRPGSPLRKAPRRSSTSSAPTIRSDAAGHLHDRRRRHPAQETRSAITKTERAHRQGRSSGARLRRVGRRAQEHGAELPHPPRRRRGASHRRRLARGEPVGARVLGRAPRRRKLRPVGRRDARLGGARARSPRRGGSPSSIARTISAARCSWRCRRDGC